MPSSNRLYLRNRICADEKNICTVIYFDFKWFDVLSDDLTTNLVGDLVSVSMGAVCVCEHCLLYAIFNVW